jgi:hypothetical protein
MNIGSLLLATLLAMAMIASSRGQPQVAQSPGNDLPLTLEGVVALVQTGVPEDLIITKIRKNGKPFDISAEEIVDLKKQGVTDTEIKLLLDPTQPYTSPPISSPGKHYPEDLHAASVPPDPGLYFWGEDKSQHVEIKMLLGQKVSGGLMKKSSTLAYLIGPASKLQIKESSPVFYIRLAEGKEIENVVLVALLRNGDRRQLDLGPNSKEELKPGIVKQFESLEVGPHLFRISARNLPLGEYLFFLMDSADPQKGNYGKGYDFQIDRAAP